MRPDTDAPTFRCPEMDPDRRLAELMLCIAEKRERDPNFGATKLNKILAFADLSAYFETVHLSRISARQVGWSCCSSP